MNNSYKYFLLSLVLFGIGFLLPNKENDKPPEVCSYQTPLSAQFDSNNNLTLSLSLACDNESRQQGLMFIEELPEFSGMLFAFPKQGPLSFWMKDTLIDLDIAFLDQDFNIIAIESLRKMQYFNKTLLIEETSTYEAQYVLEVNSGLLDKYNIQAGDTLKLHKPKK